MKKIILLASILIFPVSVWAGLMLSYDEPLEGLSDNTVIDIITHNGAVWLATGGGITFKYYNDAIWYTYDQRNGLVSEEISAIYSDSINGRLWAATNHVASVSGSSVTYADGLSFTDDDGRTWDTMMVEGSYGYQSTIYDITGYDTLIFCASWAGGLFGSFSGGDNWQHIYYSAYDSALADSGVGYLSLRNLYFSAAADMNHQDTIVLWAGSADGLMRYVYLPANTAASSNHLLDIASGGGYVFLAGDSGLTRLHFQDGKEAYHSAFMSDGIPGQAIISVFYFGGRLFIGALDSLNGAGIGLAISDDTGLTFRTDHTGLDNLIGEDKYPADFVDFNNRIYLAGLEGGLYSSDDTGYSWQAVKAASVVIDSLSGDTIAIFPFSIGRVNSVDKDSGVIWVASDSQLVRLYLDNEGDIDSLSSYPFADTDSTGARCYKVRAQVFSGTLAEEIDSTVIWTINYPIDTIGRYSVHRYSVVAKEWAIFPSDTTPYYDIGFRDSAVYLSGKNVFAISPDGKGFLPYGGITVQDSLYPNINFGGLDLKSIEIVNDTIYMGSSDGFAISPMGSNKWHIVKAITNPKRHDYVTRYAYPTIAGNFVPTLAIQTLADGSGYIWANCRPNDDDQYTGVMASPLDGSDWDLKLDGVICWNFAFMDSTVFAATSDGLLFSLDLGETWDTLNISGTLVNYNPPQPYSIGEGTEIYAAEIISDTLWVGTGDGAAMIALDDLGDTGGWEIYRAFDTTRTAYAYPIPFSPYPVPESNQITFHYPMSKDGNVTIEVYDFAMNLVRRVIDSEWKIGGPNAFYSSDKWDGKNGRGDLVAAGIYYFKISQSTGDVYWGKLAIIP